MSFYRRAADAAGKIASRVKGWFKRTKATAARKTKHGAEGTVQQLKEIGHGAWARSVRVAYRAYDVLHTGLVVLPSMIVIGVYFTAAWVLDMLNRLGDLAADLWVTSFTVLAHVVAVPDFLIDCLIYTLLVVPISYVVAKLRRRSYIPSTIFWPVYDRNIGAVKLLATPIVVAGLLLLFPFTGWKEFKAEVGDYWEGAQWYWARGTVRFTNPQFEEQPVETDLIDANVPTETYPSQQGSLVDPIVDLTQYDEVHYTPCGENTHVIVIGVDDDFSFTMKTADVTSETVNTEITKMRQRRTEAVQALDEQTTGPEHTPAYTPGTYDWQHAKDKHQASYLYGRQYVVDVFGNHIEEVLTPNRVRRAWSLLHNKAKNDSNYDLAQLRTGFNEEIDAIKSSLSATT